MSQHDRQHREELAAKGELFFAEFLFDRGYPNEAIVYRRRLKDGGRPDYIIIDPRAKEILAVVEIKANFAAAFAKNQANWHRQLAGYRASVGSLGLPAFLVVISEEFESRDLTLTFYRDDGERLVLIPSDEFPDYEALRAQVLTTNATETEVEQRLTVDQLRSVVGWLMILIAELMLLSFAGWWRPYWEQLALVAAFGALLVFPYVKKLNVLGIEIERLLQ